MDNDEKFRFNINKSNINIGKLIYLKNVVFTKAERTGRIREVRKNKKKKMAQSSIEHASYV